MRPGAPVVRQRVVPRRARPSRAYPLVEGALYLAALQQVLALDKEDLVPAGDADQKVAGVVVGDAVGPAAEEVVALAAEDPVPAALALERVHAAKAVQGVRALLASILSSRGLPFMVSAASVPLRSPPLQSMVLA